MSPNEPRRSRRRRDLARMKAKARRIYPSDPRPERWANHLAMCACPICDRSRAALGPTVQERRALAAEVCL